MTLREVCDRYGPRLTGITHRGQPMDGARLLWAIAGCESSFGQRREFVRAEPAYMPKGKYFDAPHLAEAYRRFGVLASSSFGSFQVLYITAFELGYREHPIQLQEDDTCGLWAATLIERRFIKRHGAVTLADVADSYNSGSHLDSNVPAAYIQRCIDIYDANYAQVLP